MDELINRVHELDIFELCDLLPDASVDMILCDLPYGVTACEWDVRIPLEPMWAAFKRIIKPRGAIVLTATQPFASELVMSNRAWFKYTIIWMKTRGSGFINSKNCPISIHEDILIFSPGTIANCSPNQMTFNPQGIIYAPYHKKRLKPMTAKGNGILGKRASHVAEYDVEFINYPKSIITFSNPNNANNHATQKPILLFEYLIRTYTQPGELVFDPCVGSGTTAIAARNCGRNYIVGDSSPEFCEIARKRLAKPYTLPMFDSANGNGKAALPEQLELI